MKNIKNLHSFSLSNNKISTIPLWIIEETQIKQLFLKDNLIQNIPYEFRNWILSGGYIDVSGAALQKTSEGITLASTDLEFLQKKQKEKKEKKSSPANFNNKFLKSAIYQKVEKQYPHIDLDNLSEIRPKDLPEADLEGNEIISLFNKLSTNLNLENDAKPLYLDFYEITGFWIDDADPITNKKRFQQIIFPLIKGFLKTIWGQPLSKGESSSCITAENKPLLKNMLEFIIKGLNMNKDKDLIRFFIQNLIQAVINPLNSIDIIQLTLSELQKRDLHHIEDVKDRLLQFIVYIKTLCFDATLLNIDEKYQIPIRSYYKTALDNDLGLYYQGIPTQMRMPMPINDPFEGNPWSVFDSFLMKFTPNYLTSSILENTKKNPEENHLFTIEEIALFLKDHDAWNSSDANYYEPYFTEDPFIVENQSTLTNKGAQKVLELLGVISEE